MRRRELLAVTVIATALTRFAALAQQNRVPIIGWLHSLSAERSTAVLAAFRETLAEAGYVEGRNVAIEYRWPMAFTNGSPRWLPIWSAARSISS